MLGVRDLRIIGFLLVSEKKSRLHRIRIETEEHSPFQKHMCDRAI